MTGCNNNVSYIVVAGNLLGGEYSLYLCTAHLLTLAQKGEKTYRRITRPYGEIGIDEYVFAPVRVT